MVRKRKKGLLEYNKLEFIRNVDRGWWNFVDENIGSLDKISIASPSGEVTGGILWFFSGREDIKSTVDRGRASGSRIYQALSRGGARILDKAWCWAISNFSSCRNQVRLSRDRITRNRGARVHHLTYVYYSLLEKLAKMAKFQLPARSKIKRSRDFEFKTSSRFPRYWAFKRLSLSLGSPTSGLD